MAVQSKGVPREEPAELSRGKDNLGTGPDRLDKKEGTHAERFEVVGVLFVEGLVLVKV